jgi:hypothetical protein
VDVYYQSTKYKFILERSPDPGPDYRAIIKRLEKVNGKKASKLVLRPMRDAPLDLGESDEAFAERMQKVDLRDDDDDGTDWVKVYATYISRRNTGSALVDDRDAGNDSGADVD